MRPASAPDAAAVLVPPREALLLRAVRAARRPRVVLAQVAARARPAQRALRVLRVAVARPVLAAPAAVRALAARVGVQALAAMAVPRAPAGTAVVLVLLDLLGTVERRVGPEAAADPPAKVARIRERFGPQVGHRALSR